MIYNKKTLENKARLTLCNICNHSLDTLFCDDKPDLQDLTISYGIEVVEDCYPNEKEAERFIQNIWKKTISNIQDYKIEKLKSLGGKLHEEKGLVIGASFQEVPNSPIHLINTIKRKIEKLNNGKYKKFNSYGLYVFVDTVNLFDSFVYSIIETIREYQKNKDYVFKTIYLDGYYKMYICDMEASNFSKKFISQEARDLIKLQL